MTLSLIAPEALVLGRSGALWVSDSGLGQVLCIAPDGRVTRVAGRARPTAAAGTMDTGEVARLDRQADIGMHQVNFVSPSSLALSSDEQVLYVSDSQARKIWRIDLTGGNARLIAGAPESPSDAHAGEQAGDLGPAQRALSSEVRALALDEDADSLYLAMPDVGQVWLINIGAGYASVLAGMAGHEAPTGSEDPADTDPQLTFAAARFIRPSGVALAPDRKRLYVADSGATAVRIMHLDEARVTTLIDASDGLSGCTNVALGPGGLVLVDAQHHTLWGVNPRHRTLVRLWGGAEQLCRPSAMVFDRANYSYVVADTGNQRLMRLMRDMSTATEMRLHLGD